MSTHELANTVRSTLARERGMRERVFQGDPSKLRAKLADIDRALDALAKLQTLAAQQEASQGSLFDAPARG